MYYLEWNNNLEKNPQYILKISEIILGAVYTKVPTEKIWETLCTTNLNEKFKIIIQLLVLQLEKETEDQLKKLNLRDKKISEVSVIPKDYKIILFSAEMHQILTLLQPCRYLFWEDDRLILLEIEENYYAQEKQVILVGERKEDFKYYTNNSRSIAAVLGEIKYVKRGVSHTSTAYIKPKNRVRLTDVVFKAGVFYGKVEKIRAINIKNQEELDKIKNLTESVIKDVSIYVSDIATPIFMPEIQNYEEYADNISFYIAEKLFDYTYNGCGARIKKEFYSYNVVERLFFLKEYLDTKRGSVEVINNEDRVKELIDSGKLKLKFSSNDDFKYEAIKAFNKAIMLDPKSIQEIGVLLAETYKGLRKYEDAITIYSKIKTDDPKIELAVEEGKAWSYYLLSKYKECIKAYDKAMALGLREGIIAGSFQVKSYLKLGMDEKVIEAYDKVLSKIDNDGNDKFYRVAPAIKKANILAGLKRYQEANKCYKEALDTYLNLPEPKWGLKIDMDILYIHYAISLNAVNDKQKTHFFNIAMERIKDSMAVEVRMRNIYCCLKAILLSAFGKLDEANKCYDEIKIYVNLGGYEVPQIDGWLGDSLALKIYYNILRSSDHSMSYLIRSYILSIWENYEEEKLCLDKILESKSDHAYALCSLGIVCAKLNQLDKSSYYFEKAIKCNGGDESTKVSSRWLSIEAGKVLNKLGKYEEAFESFKKSLAYDSRYVPVVLWCGETLMHLNKNEEAQEYIDMALSYDASNVASYIQKSKILVAQEQYSKALKYCESGLLLSLYNPELLEIKEILKLKLGAREVEDKDGDYWKKQLENYNQQIRVDSKDARLYLCKGDALNKLERYEEAIVAFNKALEIKPDFDTVYNCKGEALYGLQKYQEAIIECDKAISLDPKYVGAYCNKGNSLHSLERYKAAIVEYDKAIALDPKCEVVYYNKGNALGNLERYEEAIKAFDEALRLDPNYAAAYNEKATAFHQLGKYDAAIVAYNKVIELKPDDAVPYAYKGNSLNYLKQYNEALKWCNKAIALDPHFQEALDNKKAALEAIARQASNKDFEILLKNTPLSPVARKIAEQKIARLKGSQGSNDGDRSYTEKYLNYLFRLPWGKYDESSIDIIEAEKILDQNHYGLESVKQKIIESLAFMATSKDAKPPILCLVGAPGVGKTSIAKIISKALNRKSVTLSLAGARDEGLIRGCMDFYMGARPGKALSLLSEAGSSNPVMILDEIDKISQERGAVLEGALLQLIDPSQNDSFTDDYFDFGYDMSKVFFIATANSIDNISYPLLHRMEVIDISGYTDNEKVKITQDYIIPKLIEEANVTNNKFTLSDELIRYIIENYTRESGVRDIERKIRELLQKSLLAEARKEQISLTKETIDDFFKYSKYHKQKLQDDEVTIGMINGLAHTARGGDLIKIEASKYKGDGKIKATGKLGEVLKESIDAAMTCLKSSIDSKTKEIPDDILKTHDIHIHLPAGATPKDGPSAGITIYTALYSLFSNKKIRQDIAMTGEITLKGRVLEIGGLKEKLTAAVREGIKEVIIPKNNERDLAEIPEEIREALIIHPVSHAGEILGIVFNTKMSNKNTKQKVHKENMGKVLPLPKSRKKN